MTGAIIAIVIVIWAASVNAMRMGEKYPLAQVLPFCGGAPVGIYDLAGSIVLLLFFLLLCRAPYDWVDTYAFDTEEGLPGGTEQAYAPRRVRQSLWLVPLALVFAAYIRRNARPSVHWRNLLDQFHIADPQRFSQLAILIVTCSAILLVKYVWQRR